MSKEGRTYRGYWKRLIAAVLCASITVTTVFPDNGVAFAASLEDAVATEETRAANEFAEEQKKTGRYQKPHRQMMKLLMRLKLSRKK